MPSKRELYADVKDVHRRYEVRLWVPGGGWTPFETRSGGCVIEVPAGDSANAALLKLREDFPASDLTVVEI